MSDQVNRHFDPYDSQTRTHQQPSSTQQCDNSHGDSSEVTDQISSLQGLPYHHCNQQQLQDGASSLPNPQSNAVPHQHIPPSDRTLPPPQTLTCPSEGTQTSLQQPQESTSSSAIIQILLNVLEQLVSSGSLILLRACHTILLTKQTCTLGITLKE